MRVNLLDVPSGLGEREPEFSWEFEDPFEGHSRQVACQVVVAAEAPEKRMGEILWDSGRVESNRTTFIRYEGKRLESRMRCLWQVTTWDESGEKIESPVAFWTMGLLEDEDWHAKWIGLDAAPEFPEDPLPGARWIWDEVTGPGRVEFEKVFFLPSSGDGFLWGLADDEAEVEINGVAVGHLPRAQGGVNLFPLPRPMAVAGLRAGENTVRIHAKKRHDRDSHAGVILRISAGGIEMVTDAAWRSSRGGKETRLRELGSFGVPPWHLQNVTEYPNLRARYTRREFSVRQKPERATLYFSGLGLSEAWINGCRVGDEVLSPHASDYNRLVYYRTFDVTDFLRAGKNAVGCILGNGRHFAPRVRVPFPMESHGCPKLLLQLEMEYGDGTVERIVSGADWKITDDGRIGWNNEFDGEDHDGRKDGSDWSRVGYNDHSWRCAQMVATPMGGLKAQISDPIRVTEVIPAREVWTTKYGTRMWDFGVNLVGWCRGTIRGPEGTLVTLRHAEELETRNLLATENLRSAHCADRVVLGEGDTVFEPKFAYHGFRYVEVVGEAEQVELEACFVHDDVKPAGFFQCSNELLNRIVEAAARGIRGNYRSMPTDCPQRDERMGWLGDRAGGAPGEMFLFDVSKLYRKWMDDIRLAQGANGCVPDIAPPFWRMYSDNVTWASCVTFIPHWLQRHYGDTRVIERNFDAIARWIRHMEGYLDGGLLSRDVYGDWCVPPESPHLIHSEREDRKTSPVILASAYLAKNLELAAGLARHIGRGDLAACWLVRREQIAAALNARFFDPATGCYDNGSQTACLLPLAFGLTPEEHSRKSFEFLVSRITESGRPSLGTGLVGGQWLMRTLTAWGRPDIARALAVREEYPGWGYMIGRGATTIWELWNGDSADPLMNSGNHVMLLGDLITWIFEDVAGIQPADYGFKSVRFRPHFLFDEVACTHHSIHGPMGSSWKITNDKVAWEVSLPPNTTAWVELPASVARSLKLDGLAPQMDAATNSCSPFSWVKVSIGPGHHSFLFDQPEEFPRSSPSQFRTPRAGSKWKRGLQTVEI